MLGWGSEYSKLEISRSPRTNSRALAKHICNITIILAEAGSSLRSTYPVNDYKSNSKTDTYQTRISSMAACGTCCCCCSCDATIGSPWVFVMWLWECPCMWPLEELGALLTPLLLLPPDGVWSSSILPPGPFAAMPVLMMLLLLVAVVVDEEAVRNGGRGPRI